jgi:AraC family transcriptional regulator
MTDALPVEVKTWPAFTAVGIKYRGDNANQEIGDLWDVFVPRIPEVPNPVESDEAYGLMDNFELNEEGKTQAFDYLACLPVTAVGDLPDGMESWMVPEGLYVAVTVPFASIMSGFDHLHSVWLPASEYVYDLSRPEFEYYPPEFDPRKEGVVIQVCMPIKPK